MATHPFIDITNAVPACSRDKGVARNSNTDESGKVSFFARNNIALSTPAPGPFDCSDLSWVSGQEQSGTDKVHVRFASIPVERLLDFENGLKKAGG